MPNFQERVIRAIGKVAKDKDILIDSTFEELAIDSLSTIELLFHLEEEFDIEIPYQGIRNIRGVSDAVRGIERLLAGEADSFGPVTTGEGGAP